MKSKKYKQTELGLLPEDWEVKKLGEVCEKTYNGGTPSTEKLEYWKGTIPWITGADFEEQKIKNIRRYITQDAIKHSATNFIKKGTLLIVTRTGVGKIAIAPFDLAISQDITAFINKDNSDNQFLYCLLNYKDLSSLSQGTSINGILKSDLLSIPIPLPPLPEQKAIAEVLSDMDELIQTTEKLIEKKKLIKQGAMQELLTGRKRIQQKNSLQQARMPVPPPSSQVSLPDLKGLPEDWEVKKLGEVCLFQRGFDITQAEISQGDIPVFSSSGISYYHNSSRVDPPGIVTGRKGSLGQVFYIEEPFWPHDTTLWVKYFYNNYPKFIYYLLIKLKLEKFDAATSVPTLNRNNIHSIPIPLPPLSEQKAIAEVLSDMDAEIDALEKKLEKQKLMKQGLMQELLTGRVRLI